MDHSPVPGNSGSLHHQENRKFFEKKHILADHRKIRHNVANRFLLKIARIESDFWREKQKAADQPSAGHCAPRC
jgi:hypothetical protein